MTIGELLKAKGMVEFGFEGNIKPKDEWKRVYTMGMDWDLDRIIICCIILLLKRHNEGVCGYGLIDMFIIYKDKLYIRKNCWVIERFGEICSNIRGIVMIMKDIKEFIPGSNASYLLDGMMGTEV